MTKFLVLILYFCVMLFACAEVEPSSSDELRIVSLSPGITATIVDLGYADVVIGRSSFCNAVDKQVPVVGDLYTVDYERLLRLSPSDVLVQVTINGIDKHLQELAEEGLFELHTFRVDRLTDIQQMHDDILELLSEDAREMQVILDMVALPSSILMMTAGSEGAAGLCFGRETYLDDLLLMMGGTNALQKSGWVSLSLEDIGRLNPAIIIVVSDSFISEKALTVIKSLGIEIIPFTHEDVLIPSSRIVDVAKKLQEALQQR